MSPCNAKASLIQAIATAAIRALDELLAERRKRRERRDQRERPCRCNACPIGSSSSQDPTP